MASSLNLVLVLVNNAWTFSLDLVSRELGCLSATYLMMVEANFAPLNTVGAFLRKRKLCLFDQNLR